MRPSVPAVLLIAIVGIATASCSGGSAPPLESAPSAAPSAAPAVAVASSKPSAAPSALATPTAVPSRVPSTTPSPSAAPTSSTLQGPPPGLQVASGLYADVISATIPAPRQLAPLPNGDLIVGTMGSAVYIVPGAEAAGAAENASVFATLPDAQAQGVSYSDISKSIYVATVHGVYAIPYVAGDRVARSVKRILAVRTGAISPLAPPGDTDVHHTTSVLAAGNALYVSVGSSCNACAEVDPTRAVVMRADLAGGGLTTVATRVRNAIALAQNPADGHIWIGGAGQDCLTFDTASCTAQHDEYEQIPHPFEWVDDLTNAMADPGDVRANVADYAWPVCEENARPASSFASPAPRATAPAADACTGGTARQNVPVVEFPAYTTHVGMTVYAPSAGGRYRLPAPYDDALIVTSHGSWHENGAGIPIAEPSVAYVPLRAGRPATPVDFKNPTAQYRSILFNYQTGGNRIGQPSGVAVGAAGSLFVGDDYAGFVYRIRPGSDPNGFLRRAVPNHALTHPTIN